MTIEHCITQLREQERHNLDPEYCKLMRDSADHLERMIAPGIKVKDLEGHPIIAAALDMGVAYHRNETLIPAMEEVRDEHPFLTQEQAILLWLGANAICNPK
jgi:hypothetical protein